MEDFWLEDSPGLSGLLETHYAELEGGALLAWGGVLSAFQGLCDDLPCGGEDVGVDVFDGPGGVDAVDEVVGEGVKNVVALLEGFALFELVGGAVAGSDTGEGVIDRKVEVEEEVGFRGELLVDAADLAGVETADALVGHGGKIVAVKNDDLSGLQGGLDEGFDVLAAILEEELQFFLGGEAPGRGGLPEAGAVGAVGGFPGGDDTVALGAKRLREESDLGGLAGAVDAFDDDEMA